MIVDSSDGEGLLLIKRVANPDVNGAEATDNSILSLTSGEANVIPKLVRRHTPSRPGRSD